MEPIWVQTFDKNRWQNLGREMEFATRFEEDSLVLNPTCDGYPMGLHQETNRQDHREGKTNSRYNPCRLSREPSRTLGYAEHHSPIRTYQPHEVERMHTYTHPTTRIIQKIRVPNFRQVLRTRRWPSGLGDVIESGYPNLP